MRVSYDFKDQIFKKEKRYRRLAREHLSIAQISSDKIEWRAVETATYLQIPIRYEVDYLVRSIIGINDDRSPIFANRHTVEVSFPAKFPLETFKARALTDIWHPNIKWDGKAKGRICVNNQNFGRGYDLYWLVLRIGGIIQYKNYLAENIPPYPEEVKAAQWVLQYAEPRRIVNVKENIATDDSNLLGDPAEREPDNTILIKAVEKPKVSTGPIIIRQKEK